MTDKKTTSTLIDSMFGAGAHFAYSRSRRHPSVTPYIFGAKNKVELFDLEKTSELFAKTLEFIKTLGKENKTILFVGGKSEARKAVANAGLALAMPYVDGRWIGGALTNFKEIRKRIEKYERLIGERERGELTKYTKKERLLIDREIDNLEIMFGGIVSMKDLPKAMFVVDAKRENIAVKEAQDMGIPVISLVGSDCNLLEVNYPIVGNDSSKTSIEFFLSTVVKAYEEGKKTV
ncbi:MAG: 30S ribosomal protein S2 [Candidatus Pacebacteria bacterium]|jgi:small subunit ribosomal protein S2|nr:30S ribosomal protein S2 [Candidatus Paceibacterota bacterium]